MQTGLMTSVPYIFGTLGILVFGHVSDKYKERRWTLFAALCAHRFGLIAAGLMTGSLLAVGVMAVAAIGIYGTKAPFWPLPSLFLAGSAAAGGIALINSIGNLGGFVGPYMVGWIREVTNSYEAGLYFLGGLALVAAVLTSLSVNARFAEALSRLQDRAPPSGTAAAGMACCLPGLLRSKQPTDRACKAVLAMLFIHSAGALFWRSEP